jgi:hypothetical protein
MTSGEQENEIPFFLQALTIDCGDARLDFEALQRGWPGQGWTSPAMTTNGNPIETTIRYRYKSH